MALFFESISLDVLSILISIIAVIIAFFKWKFTYWERRGVPSLNPFIPFGDTKKMILNQETFGLQFKEIYDKFKAMKVKHGGYYASAKAEYMPIDPELLKHILVKDFGSFMNHGGFVNEQDDPLNGHLFNLEDDKWRDMRVKLTPTFTSGKMKMMFQTMADCTKGLEDIFEDYIRKNEALDIKDVLGRFTTDIIGSVGFGLDCNSLKDPNSEFRVYGKKAFEIDFITQLKFLAATILPYRFLKMIKLKIVKSDVESFFMDIVRKNLEYREKNNIYRKDFFHLLIQLKNRGFVADDELLVDGDVKKEGLTFNELAAQAFVFFAAGFETSSTTGTFCLYELACNQDVQEKLRSEVKTILAKYDNKITYEAIQEMTYMDRVLQETLRKFPPVPFLPRKTTKDYNVPGTSVIIEKGTEVKISTLGIHHDPEYYPDPEKFDPDRFTEENKAKRPSMTWLPFGEGPRLCIGLRFGVLQSKVAIAAILKNYRISLNKRTCHPIKLDKRSFILSAEGGVWLDAVKI